MVQEAGGRDKEGPPHKNWGPQLRPAPEAPEGVVVQEARELQERAPQFDSHADGNFVLRSMTLPKDKGTMFSDNGAVRCREGDPCHYV